MKNAETAETTYSPDCYHSEPDSNLSFARSWPCDAAGNELDRGDQEPSHCERSGTQSAKGRPIQSLAAPHWIASLRLQ